jgi:uncharacterized protein YndB with AHSA1/START domain
MADIIHRIGIACAPDKVFGLLTTDAGLSRWWTTDTSGAGSVGSTIKFRFNGMGPDFEVAELRPDSLVRWRHSGEVPDAWMGAQVSFRLTHENNQTYVLFSHSNWSNVSDFMGHCSTKWAVFLLSLKAALESGKGRPFPNDIQIDHDE